MARQILPRLANLNHTGDGRNRPATMAAYSRGNMSEARVTRSGFQFNLPRPRRAAFSGLAISMLRRGGPTTSAVKGRTSAADGLMDT